MELTDITTEIPELTKTQQLLENAWDKLLPFAGRVAIALIVLLVGYIILRLILKISAKALTRANLDKIVCTYIHTCLKAVIWVVIIISILTILGVPTTSLIALISAAGVAIALALQNSLSNLAGGILIILNKPFTKGDLIDAQGVSGKVEEIHLMNCRLHTLNNKHIIIPNGNLFNGTIVNYSSTGMRRVDLSVGVSYDADLAKTKNILLEIAEQNPVVLDEPRVSVGVRELADSAIVLDFMIWCRTENYWQAYYSCMEAIAERLPRENIIIPYPQLDVHIKNDSEPRLEPTTVARDSIYPNPDEE